VHTLALGVMRVAWVVKHPKGWLVRWRLPAGQGPRKWKSRFFKDLGEAEAFRDDMNLDDQARRLDADIDRKIERGEFTPAQVAFMRPGRTPAALDAQHSVERFMRAMVLGNLGIRETTRALYVRTINTWIKDTDLGKADIRYVTAQELEQWWSSLPHREKPGATNNAVQLLRTAMRRAVKRGLRDDNPLERTDIRKVAGRRRAVQVLTTEQVEALADAASSTRDRVEILVLGYGALRAGELGGLRLQDIDWQRDQVHLEQQVVRTGEGLQVSPLKTAAARRVVSLPHSVVEELRQLVDEVPPSIDGLVFKGVQGGMRDSVRINTSLQRAARRVGLQTHPHALRHTAVSQWIADGASPLDIQRMVGHANVTMTLGTYGHLFSHGGADLAASMEARRESHRNRG
jgi:integrase